MRLLLDERGIDTALERMAGEIARQVDGQKIALVGVRSRGDVLTARIGNKLADLGIRSIPVGALDITLYRDDLAEIGPSAVVRTTEIPFDVAGLFIVLIDDVIFTGRSTRAALDALMDLGRPRAIRLAVLVDRGGRELPIQPDFVGLRTQTPAAHVRVLLKESDGVDRVEAEP